MADLIMTISNGRGPQGPAGADGVDGAQGPQGPKGDKGDTGAIGPQGTQGPIGPAGADGADGIDGVSTDADNSLSLGTDNRPYFKERPPLTTTEDIEIVSNTAFIADRSASPLVSKGFRVIRQNFDFTNIPSSYANCIWEIRYKHDLGGEDITIPEGVTLKFSGGMFSNFGVITGNYTSIIAGYSQIFDATGNFAGRWEFDCVLPQWFGAKANGINDDTVAFQKTIDFTIKTSASLRTITIKGNIIIYDTITITEGSEFSTSASVHISSETGNFRGGKISYLGSEEKYMFTINGVVYWTTGLSFSGISFEGGNQALGVSDFNTVKGVYGNSGFSYCMFSGFIGHIINLTDTLYSEIKDCFLSGPYTSLINYKGGETTNGFLKISGLQADSSTSIDPSIVNCENVNSLVISINDSRVEGNNSEYSIIKGVPSVVYFNNLIIYSSNIHSLVYTNNETPKTGISLNNVYVNSEVPSNWPKYIIGADGNTGSIPYFNYNYVTGAATSASSANGLINLNTIRKTTNVNVSPANQLIGHKTKLIFTNVNSNNGFYIEQKSAADHETWGLYDSLNGFYLYAAKDNYLDGFFGLKKRVAIGNGTTERILWVVQDHKYPYVKNGEVFEEISTKIYGPTANRPTNPKISTRYFDTDINRNVTWNGSSWEDTIGNFDNILWETATTKTIGPADAGKVFKNEGASDITYTVQNQANGTFTENIGYTFVVYSTGKIFVQGEAGSNVSPREISTVEKSARLMRDGEDSWKWDGDTIAWTP